MKINRFKESRVYSKIDSHVHCRDWAQKYKTTIKDVTNLARKNGISAIIDMPNTRPLLTSQDLVEIRLQTAELEGCLEGYYLNMGVTKNAEQVKKAAEVAMKHLRVVGLKYFTTGVDEISLINENDQFELYRTLAKCEYTGNIIPHCEKESFFRLGKFNPEEPWTWDEQRPVEAEESAVNDQISFAIENNFQGHIHIPHISSPRSIDIIKKFSNKISLSGEVTPHHLLYSAEDSIGKTGLDRKINPPLRKKEFLDSLWEKLKETTIRFTIGTDHAPHTLEEKRDPKFGYLSGHPSLLIYQTLLGEMRKRGISEKRIIDLTYTNAKAIFSKIIE